MNLAHNKSEIERRVHAVIDKFAERGLRSLAVAYQVCSYMLLCLVYVLNSFQTYVFHIIIHAIIGNFHYLMCRKFLMGGRRAKEGHGSLLVSCPYLTRLDMIVQRQYEEHWILGWMLRWSQVCSHCITIGYYSCLYMYMLSMLWHLLCLVIS